MNTFGSKRTLGHLYCHKCSVLNFNVHKPSRLLSQKVTDSQLDQLDQLRTTLKNGSSPDATNKALEQGLAHDFSLYYTINNEAKHPWSPGALKALIDHNPGRAFTSMSLLEKHGRNYLEGEGNVEEREQVVLSVIKKLLEGEKSELRELEEHEVFKPSVSSIKKAVALINLCSGLETVGHHLNMVFDRLVEEGDLGVLSAINFDGWALWLQTKLNSSEDPKVQYELTKLVFGLEPTLLSKESLALSLKYGGMVGSKELSGEKNSFVDQLLDYVETNQLDLDKKDPSSLFLRMQLMETYLIDKDSVNTALEKFHHYQTFEKFGLEFVQAKLVQGFSYQAVKKNDTTSLKIAETFVDHENLTVTTLCQLILANSRFSSEKSLEIYNNYINSVSKEVNEVTGRSPTGSLTEALMVANLYDNDREFAQLLYEKAVTSGMVKDEKEIAVMKRVLKVYGDSFVENSWEAAKPIFENYVLECIRR